MTIRMSDIQILILFNKFSIQDDNTYTFDDIPLFIAQTLKRKETIPVGKRINISTETTTRQLPQFLSEQLSKFLSEQRSSEKRASFPRLPSIPDSDSDDEFLREKEIEKESVSFTKLPLTISGGKIVSSTLPEMLPSNITKLPSVTDQKMVKELDLNQVLNLIQINNPTQDIRSSSITGRKITSLLGL